MKTPVYADLFQRNIGVFTTEEQERIRGLVVAIAGAGGLGGPVAYNLARLGVGEIRLADPETFEPSNTNRQWGCYADTIGMNKAEAVAVELKRINPHLCVVVMPEPITAQNANEFTAGADFVVDGIDFFALAQELTLHAAARRAGAWVYMHQGAKEIQTYCSFDPEGTAYGDLVCVDGKPSVMRAIQTCFPVLPRMATPELVDEIVASGTHIPSYATLPSFAGAFVVEEIIRGQVFLERPRAVAPRRARSGHGGVLHKGHAQRDE